MVCHSSQAGRHGIGKSSPAHSLSAGVTKDLELRTMSWLQGQRQGASPLWGFLFFCSLGNENMMGHGVVSVTIIVYEIPCQMSSIGLDPGLNGLMLTVILLSPLHRCCIQAPIDAKTCRS